MSNESAAFYHIYTDVFGWLTSSFALNKIFL